jgi:DNA-binding XRE family transcriptional regulator
VDGFAELFDRQAVRQQGESDMTAKAESTGAAPATKAAKPRIDAAKAAAKIKEFDGKKMGERLNDLREMLGVEVDELSKVTGITKQRIGKLEQDAAEMTAEEAHRLAAAYEYTAGGMIKRLQGK